MAVTETMSTPTKTADTILASTPSDSDDVSSPELDRAEFLATFTAEDEKRILRKVDRHLIALSALIYAIKQVNQFHSS